MLKRVRGGTRLAYNAREWRRSCRHPDLDSPVLCLLAKDANGGEAHANGVVGRH